MNYNCMICDKAKTCKKNKNSNTNNCKLFIPNEEKERELLKERKETERYLKKRFPNFPSLVPFDYTEYL